MNSSGPYFNLVSSPLAKTVQQIVDLKFIQKTDFGGLAGFNLSSNRTLTSTEMNSSKYRKYVNFASLT